MTEKQLIETKDVGFELLRLMGSLALQLPISMNYELWKDLHQLQGDWE